MVKQYETAPEWFGFQGIILPLAGVMPFVKESIAKLPVKIEFDMNRPYEGTFSLTCPCGQTFSGNWCNASGNKMFCVCGKLYYIDGAGRLFDLTHLRDGDRIAWPSEE